MQNRFLHINPILKQSQNYKKLFKQVSNWWMKYNLVVMGENMSEFIWYWTKGNTKVYTKNAKVAEKAMKEGKLVMGIRPRSSIVKY